MRKRKQSQLRVTGGRSENDTLVSIWAISVRHETETPLRPRLSCRQGEESRRNARNKRDETGSVGCASCHLHCVVAFLLSFSPCCDLFPCLPFSRFLSLSLFSSLLSSLLVAHPFLDLVSPRPFSGIPYTYFSFLVFLGSFLSSVRDSVVFCRRLVAPQGYNSHWRFPCVLVSPRSMPNHPWAAVCYWDV